MRAGKFFLHEVPQFNLFVVSCGTFIIFCHLALQSLRNQEKRSVMRFTALLCRFHRLALLSDNFFFRRLIFEFLLFFTDGLLMRLLVACRFCLVLFPIYGGIRAHRGSCRRHHSKAHANNIDHWFVFLATGDISVVRRQSL